jgi:hypothetical protein
MPLRSLLIAADMQALQDELVSKAFTGQSGRALYADFSCHRIFTDDDSLMNSTINTKLGKREERNLMYGRYKG